MTDDMDAKDVYDGSSTYYEFKFGNKSFLVGGYMAVLINNNFKEINSKFIELEQTVKSNQ